MLIKVLSLLVIVASLLTSAPDAGAQSLLDLEPDEEQFGDIFVHPRDRKYSPGKAPDSAQLFKFTEQYKDSRGDVARWEYRKGNTIIFREVWIDADGNKRGIIQVGPSF